jgi:hypothetical protein
MMIKPLVFLVATIGIVQLASFAQGQELDSSDIRKDVRQRNEETNKLSVEDQLKLRAAERKAAEDPDVKAALAKRDKAIQEFRAAVRASMIKTDPTIQPIVERVWR